MLNIFNKISLLYRSLLLVAISCWACTPKVATIVLVPDTQYYAEKYPEILHSQIDWIVENKEDIDFVLQQGDLTQNNNKEEWEIVQSAFYKLNNQLPYILAVGNHDMGSAPGKFADTRNTTLFNSYFPYDVMAQLPGFGGVYEPGKMDNAYYLVEAGNHKWMILTLEFGPRNTVLDWANEVVKQYPDRTIILNTHSYMYSDSTRQSKGDSWRPQAYGVGKDTGENAVNDGEQIWQKLVRKHPNIRFVFSGHILNTGVGTLISINDAGNPVYQFLANYQSGVEGAVKGGNGYLRILNIDLKKNRLNIQTYSPYIDQYMKEKSQDFIINHVIVGE